MGSVPYWARLACWRLGDPIDSQAAALLHDACLKAVLTGWLYTGEFLGAVIVYLGFVQATV